MRETQNTASDRDMEMAGVVMKPCQLFPLVLRLPNSSLIAERGLLQPPWATKALCTMSKDIVVSAIQR